VAKRSAVSGKPCLTINITAQHCKPDHQLHPL
jgi:hypothetical protein